MCGTTTIACMDSKFMCCLESQGYGNVLCKGSNQTSTLYASGKCCNIRMFSYQLCPSTCNDGVYGSSTCTGCVAGHD